MKLDVSYSVRIHPGRVRENNEDNFYVNGVILPQDIANCLFSLDGIAGAPSVFAVCDGMGGEDDGEVASRLAVKTLAAVQKQLTDSPEQINVEVQSYIKKADHAIRMASAGKRSGTTLALAVVSDCGTQCFNLGDSRIYCLRDNHFSQVTNDHTVGAEQRKNKLSLGESGSRSHRLTRCLGIGKLQMAEEYPFIPGTCRLLLCSDGLSDMLSDDELMETLSSAEPLADVTDSLLEQALERGGRDNVTIVVADIRKQPLLFHRKFGKK